MNEVRGLAEEMYRCVRDSMPEYLIGREEFASRAVVALRHVILRSAWLDVFEERAKEGIAHRQRISAQFGTSPDAETLAYEARKALVETLESHFETFGRSSGAGAIGLVRS